MAGPGAVGDGSTVCVEQPERRLLEASEAGDLQLARGILRQGGPEVDVNWRDEAGNRPLILAARHGHVELVQLLLDARADVEATDESGAAALLAASEHPGNAAVLRALLQSGASINQPDRMGRTPLIGAASVGDLANVQLLCSGDPEEGIERQGRQPEWLERARLR